MPRMKKELTKEYFEIFPTRLRELIENKRISQQEVANGIGKTRQMVGNYANGLSSPDWQTIAKIADFFEVSTDYLVGRSDITSRNEVEQNINAETGLSQYAIIELMARKTANRKEKADFISHLIEDVELSSLITAIRCKNNFKDTHETVLIEAGEYSNFVDLESVYKTEAENIFWKIVSTYRPNKEG